MMGLLMSRVSSTRWVESSFVVKTILPSKGGRGKETNKKEKKNNYNNDPTRLYQGGKDTESKGKPVMETLLRLYQIEEKRK